MHSDSLNWPKRRLLSDPYSPLCIVMSVRASAFGANHRRSASPSRPLETSSTTQRQDLPSLLNLKRPRVVALLLRHPVVSLFPQARPSKELFEFRTC